MQLETTARLKWPVADSERGLGTGTTDVYLQLDGYRSFGSFTPFTAAGYRWLGNNPRYRLRDGMYGSVGSLYRLTTSVTVGASLDWRQRILAGGDHAAEATMLLVYRIDERWNMIGYVLKGFSDASPDVGVGLAVTVRIP